MFSFKFYLTSDFVSLFSDQGAGLSGFHFSLQVFIKPSGSFQAGSQHIGPSLPCTYTTISSSFEGQWSKAFDTTTRQGGNPGLPAVPLEPWYSSAS